MSALTLQKFNSIDEVKQAIKNGSEVYVCYGHKRFNHAGMLFWNNSKGYMRRFMGLNLAFDFNHGRNNEPNLYFIQT